MLTIRTMRATQAVSFEVEQIEDLTNPRTVLAFGVFEELTGTDEQRVKRSLSERFAPFVTSETAPPSSCAAHGAGPFRSAVAPRDLLLHSDQREDGPLRETVCRR